MSYLTKLKGSPASIPPRPSFKEISFISLGAFFAACVVGFLAYYTNEPIIMGSFGASIFVLFVLPDSPFAQPRNVIFGHFVTTLIGLTFFSFSEFSEELINSILKRQMVDVSTMVTINQG